MKEIKFRAFCPTDKNMTTAFDITAKGEMLGLPDDTIVMQFTGLLDKNDKEIYEGDILDYEDEGQITDSFIEPVVWSEEYGYFCTESSNHVWAEVARMSKVIGNIYENPELISNN